MSEATGDAHSNGASCCLACGELLQRWGDGYGHIRDWRTEGP